MNVGQCKKDSNQRGPSIKKTLQFGEEEQQLTLSFTPSTNDNSNVGMAPRPEANAMPRAVSLSPTEQSEDNETASMSLDTEKNDSETVDLTEDDKKDERRRSKRAKKSTLVYIDGQAVLAKNNYQMKGHAYQYGTDFETAPRKSKRNKGVTKPRAPSKSRSVAPQEKKRVEHNNAVAKRIKDKKGRRTQFLASNLNVMGPFLEERVAKKLRAVPKTTQNDSEPNELFLQPEAIQADMRDYQLAGLNWMVKMYDSNLACILGDEMGLGKTLQTISLICHLKERGVSGPSLVICPLSVVYSWCRELEQWAPSLKFLRLHSSSPEEREAQKQSFQERATQYDVVITTYEMAKATGLRSLWTRMHFNLLILDEGHRIKDATNHISQAVRLIHCENKLILTGTPLQNNLIELWALLNFLYPDVFVSNDRFAEAFDLQENVIDKEKLLEAHALLGLFMIRRLKTEVEKLMPKKVETKVICPLSCTQIYWYKALLMKNINILARTNGGEGATSATNAKVLSNLVMQLRKCCLHPFLFDGAEVNTDETTCEDLIAASGKLAVLDMLLRSLYEKKHRVVLFSQFTRVLDILDDYCTMRGFKRCRFDGSTARTKRNHVVNQFNAEGSDCFVFLMSTRSGGMGLNLQTADTCILFDSDWNPQPDLQAMARVHRIGQKKTVHVYRLVCGGTIEERMVERAQKKLYLDQMVNQDSLVGLEDGEELGGVSKDELLKTLKFGCDAVFGGDVENQNTLPTLEDIDLITDRNRSNDLSEASGKLKGATSTFADFKAEGDFTSTTKLGGIDFKEIRDKHRKTFKDMGGIADSWSKLQKRIRKNRIVQVKGKGSGYGAAFVPVLASNNYDLENGESSVFQRELSESKGNYGDIKRRVKRSGVDFESQDHCQVCGDGGTILCCPRCPVCVHAECIGVDDPENFLSCPHHRCIKCKKNILAAGGLLFPCQSCSLSFCEDCLPREEAGFRFLDGADRFGELGFHSDNLCYIHCSAHCEEYAKQEFNWSPPSAKLAPVPPALDVSHAFGTQVDANIDEANSEEIVESRLRKRTVVNYKNVVSTDHSMTPASLRSPEKGDEDPNFAIDEASCDDSDDISYEEAKGPRSKAARQPAPKTLSKNCYDAVLPYTEYGYLLNLSCWAGNMTVFFGYRKLPDGSAGPAEKANQIRGIGDRIIAVNGVDVSSFNFHQVLDLVRSLGASKVPIVATLREKTTFPGRPLDKSNYPVEPRSMSMYSATSVRKCSSLEGSMAPVSQPTMDRNGLHICPTGRGHTGVSWDAKNSIWIPDDSLYTFSGRPTKVPWNGTLYNAAMARINCPPNSAIMEENTPFFNGPVSASAIPPLQVTLAPSKPAKRADQVPPKQVRVTNTSIVTSQSKPSASLKRKVEDVVVDLTGSDNERPAKQLSKSEDPPIASSPVPSPHAEDEYEVSIPVTKHGLLLEAAVSKGRTVVFGYRRAADGTRGPAEIGNLIRQAGDRIIAVNSTDISNMTYTETINLLVESQKNASHVHLRLQAGQPACAKLHADHDPTKALDPPAQGEYDVCIPTTSRGLMVRVGDLYGSTVFLEYRRGHDGEKGYAETNNLIRNVGDKIVAVNGVAIKSYHHAIGLIQESRASSYTYLRFQENRDI